MSFLFFHVLGLQSGVTLWTSLFIFTLLALKPLVDAVRMEEMSTNWNPVNDIAFVELVDANDAFCRLKFIAFGFELNLLELFQEQLNMVFFLLSDLMLDILVVVVALHLGDLALESSDVVDSSNIVVPIRIWLIPVEVNVVGFVNITSHTHGCQETDDTRADESNGNGQNAVKPGSSVKILLHVNPP